jgi:hypothetical protein
MIIQLKKTFKLPRLEMQKLFETKTIIYSKIENKSLSEFIIELIPNNSKVIL